MTPGKNSGKSDEKSVLRANLQADHCYVLDRWYAQFTLFNEIHRIDSSYVCRVRDNSRYEILETNALSDAAVERQVLSDEVVELGLSGRAGNRPDHPVRLVCVKTTPHAKRGGRKGSSAAPPPTACCGSPRTCSIRRPN